MFRVATAAFLVAGLVSKVSAKDPDCVAPCDADGICTYTAKVNLFASELGYFTFDECPDMVNPTIGMTVGKTYRFVQSDRSNYYHPMGFAYYPDGAHDDKDELEPGILPPGSSSICASELTCPAPMYFENGSYLGTYSNIASIKNETTLDDNFGLDDYEPKFFFPFGDWSAFGDFEIFLKFDIEDYTDDIFYFCHIHQFMSGRIKLLNDAGETLNSEDSPPLGYEYDSISEFDEKCGTFNISDYQLPNEQCPDRFVCDVAESDTDLRDFSDCIDAMNCAMMAGMTSQGLSQIALFIQQMIPHHQNAVNMAKALLKTGDIQCPDVTVESDGCTMEFILREIINGQNAQIQSMLGVLESMGYPEHADCVVPVFGEEDIATSDNGAPTPSGGAPTPSAGGAPTPATSASAGSILCLALFSSVFSSVFGFLHFFLY